MKECKTKKISEDGLEKVSGGVNFGTENAEKICDAIGEMYTDLIRINPPKYPCPECGSWNVGNYDPGKLYQMRVYCKDCGFFGCRDGGDDLLWNNDIADELEKLGL